MPFDAHATGYRQPAQARIFGTGGLVVVALIALIVLTIRVIPPPPAVIDAEAQPTMFVTSVQLEPAEAPQTSADSPEPAVQQRRRETTPRQDPVLPVPSMPSTQAQAIVAIPSAAPSSRPSAAPARAIAVVAPPVAGPAQVSPSPMASASAAADWRARILGHLKRYRRYPRQAENARQQGTARVAITLSRAGNVTAVELVRGSGYPLLDMEARATVRRASPLPAPDAAVPGDPITIEVPIDFALR